MYFIIYESLTLKVNRRKKVEKKPLGKENASVSVASF
jgi:hypothetical protein